MKTMEMRTDRELLEECLRQFKHIDEIYDFEVLPTTTSLMQEIEQVLNLQPVIKSVCDHPQFDILGCPFDNQECEKCQYFPSQTVF